MSYPLNAAITIVSRCLPDHMQEAVLGDLEECNASALNKLLSLLHVVAIKQFEPWYSWQPWIAGSIALSTAFLLLSASFETSLDLRHLAQGHSAHTGWLLLAEILLLVAWSWTTGFTIGSLSRRTVWASAILCAIPCLSCVTHFHVPSLSRYCVLLFLAPGLLGAAIGMRIIRLRFIPAIFTASSMTCLMLGSTGMLHCYSFLLIPAWFLVVTAERTEQRLGAQAITRKKHHIIINLMLLSLFATLPVFAADSATSQLVPREIQSKNFANSKIGVSPVRKLLVYLPTGYDASTQRYPVVYFFPSPFDSFRAIFDKQGAQSILDRAITAGSIGRFIFVTVDMTTPLGSSWYVNSSATGNWEDFVVQELVPYIDANFRTVPMRDSRGIAGHFMGAYGAIRIAMEHPDVFGSVYGLHPVGTGNGVKVLAGLPNWDIMENAKTLDDVRKDGYSIIFTSIFEAHVPNPNNPPLYIDFPAHRVNGRLVIDSKVMDRMRNNFFLESLVGQYADNMKSLRGFKFDWDRNDGNFDHIYSAQAFTHKLNEYGIPHEAEEYNGISNEDIIWGPEGRVTTDLLPFFARHLVF